MMKLTSVLPFLALIVGAGLPALAAAAAGDISSGTATGIQHPGNDTTGVTITGRHTPPSGGGIEAGCPATVTVDKVIFDGLNDVSALPLIVQLSIPGAPNHCIYEHTGPPRVKVYLGADGGGPTFSFRLEYRQGDYPGAAPGSCPAVSEVLLETDFTLSGPPADRVVERKLWSCFGPRSRPSNFLSTP
jgi:hypothetical protein